MVGCKTKSKQLKDIEKEFPNCEIRKVPNHNMYDQWLVKTPSNKIIYVYLDAMWNIVSVPMY